MHQFNLRQANDKESSKAVRGRGRDQLGGPLERGGDTKKALNTSGEEGRAETSLH